MRTSPEKPLTIGVVACRAGVGVETVRFYERQGLLEEPARRQSGYRAYDEAVVARLRFIRRAKDLGFTLREIKELLSLRHDPATPAGDLKRRAEEKLADIDAKIQTLQRRNARAEWSRSGVASRPPGRSWLWSPAAADRRLHRPAPSGRTT